MRRGRAEAGFQIIKQGTRELVLDRQDVGQKTLEEVAATMICHQHQQHGAERHVAGRNARKLETAEFFICINGEGEAGSPSLLGWYRVVVELCMKDRMIFQWRPNVVKLDALQHRGGFAVDREVVYTDGGAFYRVLLSVNGFFNFDQNVHAVRRVG